MQRFSSTMKKKKIIVLVIVVFHICLYASAQNSRIKSHHTIGWYNYFGTFRVGAKSSVHTEYQWRRNELAAGWQQSLFRTGFNYQLTPKLQLRAGYAWIETWPYGDIPLNVFGKTFTEHRLFQAVTLTDRLSVVELSHRFMQEQRWIGRYSQQSLDKEDEFVFTNRFRYMFRLQLPLKGKAIDSKVPYVAAYDEVFIGFGKNVGENIFDQNRLGFLLGYRFNPLIRVELGFLNQILMLGREVGGRNVVQYNNGVIVNTIFDFNLVNKN